MKTSHHEQEEVGSHTNRDIGATKRRKGWIAGVLAWTLTTGVMLHAQDVTDLERKLAKSMDSGLARVIVTGPVFAINSKSRELTITGFFGDRLTVKADQSVTNLDTIVVGDTVRVDYFLIGRAEIRSPTDDEKKKPMTVLEARDLPDNPYKSDATVYKVVATLEALDRSVGTVTIKGPNGSTTTVKVADVKVFEKHKLGETIVITYIEPVAIWIEKINPTKAP
jgi:hypothetical protein